ncbi:unnamed protein product [Adineta ricciae]|uniref:Uncharacterized protein n=1 Tax=Adineta ricciae TaxID=249248 RepID=A0A815CIX1_ADIRI|nr:unnamed protein product [Adineta ricciae]CAF1287903.1 unnamed protein product [Adineta ricciae]
MKRSDSNVYLTTNRDYGSFYSGRLQHGKKTADEVARELMTNDQIRNERRQLPSIAYDLMFDKHSSFQIVHRNKKRSQPVISRLQMKYMNVSTKTYEERQLILKDTLKAYAAFIECIYANKQEKNPKLSCDVLELVAYELHLLNPDLSSDELAEQMVAVTVPHEYLGMSSINPVQSYPGSVNDCAKTPRLQRLLDHFEIAKKMVLNSKQEFDSTMINSQSLHGTRYIYNPFNSSKSSCRI